MEEDPSDQSKISPDSCNAPGAMPDFLCLINQSFRIASNNTISLDVNSYQNLIYPFVFLNKILAGELEFLISAVLAECRVSLHKLIFAGIKFGHLI